MFSCQPKPIFCGSTSEARREPLFSPVYDDNDDGGGKSNQQDLVGKIHDEYSVFTDSTTSSTAPSTVEASSSPPIPTKDDPRPTAAYQWLMAGNNYVRNGKLSFAKNAFLQAIENCSISESNDHDHRDDTSSTASSSAALENLSVLADAYSNLATVHWKEGKMSQAMDVLAESLRVHEHYQQLVGLPDVPNMTAATCTALPMPLDDKYVSMYGSQIQSMAAVYHQLGLAFGIKSCYKQAHKAVYRAYMLRLWVHGNNKPHKQVAESLKALGNLAFMQQQFDAALVYYEQLFAMNCNLGSDEKVVISTDMIHSLTRMAATYRSKGDLRSALFGYRVILSMKQELLFSVDDNATTTTKVALRQSIGQSFMTIGDLLFESDSYRSAKEAYQSAHYFYVASGLCPTDKRRQQANCKLNQLCANDNLDELM